MENEDASIVKLFEEMFSISQRFHHFYLDQREECSQGVNLRNILFSKKINNLKLMEEKLLKLNSAHLCLKCVQKVRRKKEPSEKETKKVKTSLFKKEEGKSEENIPD